MQIYEGDQYQRGLSYRNDQHQYNKNKSQMPFLENKMNNNNRKDPNCSVLYKKRQEFRQKIRKQYLFEYFSRKRAVILKESYDYQFNSDDPNNYFNKQQNQGEIQIDRYPQLPNQVQLQNCHFKPQYNRNYFQSVILLQQLIRQKDEINYERQQQNQTVFKYNSFYDFVIKIISESLDPQYFFKFRDKGIFENHFNQLKKMIYKKLIDEIKRLLLDFNEFNLIKNRQQSWAFEMITIQTIQKLVSQFVYFIKSQNLVSHKQQYNHWPRISVEEQITFLLNIFLEITYKDQVKQQKYEEQFDKLEIENDETINLHQLKNQNRTNQNKISSFSITNFMINEKSLLDELKFLITFGCASDQFDQHQRQGNKRRYRLIDTIIKVLRNVGANIGSDILFDQYLIHELLFILKEQQFRVDIRRKNNKNNQMINQNHTYQHQQSNSNNLKHKNDYVSNSENSIEALTILKLQIKSFILQSFKLLRKIQSLEHLTKIDSFSFIIECLKQLYELKTAIQRYNLDQSFTILNNDKYQQRNHSSQNYSAHLRQNKQNDQQQYLQQYQYLNDLCDDLCDFSTNNQYKNRYFHQQQMNYILYQSQIINNLVFQCISSLQYHFQLGQVNVFMRMQQQRLLQLTEKQRQKQKQKQRYYQQQSYQSQQLQQNRSKKPKIKNKNDYQNPYLIKFYSIKSQNILDLFQQQAKYLLEKLSNLQFTYRKEENEDECQY